MPFLLGSLLAGLTLRNTNYGIGSDSRLQDWSSGLRTFALGVIMLRAGLHLDIQALIRLKGPAVRLAALPCTIEATVVAVLSWKLWGFDWATAYMLGFVVAAVSPAVVVPGIINLSQRGYGTAKGIPTLVLAAASFDDVLAITGFNIALGVKFAEGSVAWNVAKGPVEILIGVLAGGLVGTCTSRLTRKPTSALTRTLFVLTAAMACIFGAQSVHLGGAGALACLVLGNSTRLGWSPEEMTQVGTGTDTDTRTAHTDL